LDIAFKNRKLEKTFNSEFDLQKAYGKPLARKIMMRLEVLGEAKNLASISTEPPHRSHLLRGDRSGQFAVDLDQSRRFVFKPNHDPIMRTEDGGIDVTQATASNRNKDYCGHRLSLMMIFNTEDYSR